MKQFNVLHLAALTLALAFSASLGMVALLVAPLLGAAIVGFQLLNTESSEPAMAGRQTSRHDPRPSPA